MTKPPQLHEFGPFLLNPAERLLLRAGAPVPLTPKAFDTLLIFLEHGNHLLSKDELIAKIWPDSFVEESNLAQHVSAVRRALGEQPNGKPYIETVPKRGYRFVAEVRTRPLEQTADVPAFAPLGFAGEAELRFAADEPAPRELAAFDFAPPVARVAAPVASPAASPGAPPAIKLAEQAPPVGALFTRRRKLGAAGVLLVLVAVGLWFWRTAIFPGNEGKQRVAVLPFRNLKPDPAADFLGFSLADAVITKLNYVNSLTVRPSAYVERYRHRQIDPPGVARELNVDSLLTGTYVKEGDDLRISLQLIDAAANQVLWSEELNLKYDKLLTVQDRVSREVIERLSVSLSPAESEQLRRDAPRYPQAYEYHLRGVDLYFANDLVKAGKLLEQSVALDPGYALSWSYLGAAYTAFASLHFGGREYYDKAQRAYDRAIALAPTQIEAQMFRGHFLTELGRVEEAIPLLRAVAAANPNFGQAHWELAYAYRFGGLLKESIAEGERARRIAGEIKASNAVFNSYLYDGQYDRFLGSLPADSESPFVNFYRGLGHYYLKDFTPAAALFDRAYQANPALMPAQAGKALSYAAAGKSAEGLALLRRTEQMIAEKDVRDAEGVYKVAQAFAVLGDKISARRLLQRSIAGGFFCHPYFVADPLLAGLRGEAEYASLMEQARRRHEAFKRKFF